MFQLETNLNELLDRVPHHLQEPLQSLLEVDARRRPNAQNFSMVSIYLCNITVLFIHMFYVISIKLKQNDTLKEVFTKGKKYSIRM